jgi:hypothetical protein
MVFRKLYFFFLAFVVIASGCVKEDFDVPPIDELPELTPNATIEQLKSLHTLGRTATQVTEDWVIDAVVAADDESGNLFRQIAVQDETGGIVLRLNATDLYTIYPEGSTLFIRAKDLYVGDFNGLYQVNGSPEDPIEELLIPNFIVPSNDPPGEVEATVLTIPELQSDAVLNRYQGTLIQLDEVQFVAADSEVPYADAVGRNSLNRTLEDCSENEIIVRSSGFADFAADLTPAGNGTLTGVLSVFGSTRQILLRDPDYDVRFTGDRCGGGGGSGGDLISLEELRSAFAGGTDAVPDARSVRGVVISDVDNGNTTGRNLVLQDETGGIVIRFTGNHGFALGQELEIAVGGLELSEFNGLLQINEVPNGNAVSQGVGTLPTPRPATVAEVLANAEAWESTLVELTGVTLDGGATYSGSVDVSDASGALPMFTRSAASFADSPLPGGTVDLTAVVSDFNGVQVFIRNLDDVVGGMTGGGDPEPVTAMELRDLFNSGAGSVPANRFIEAVVISDGQNGNTTGRNAVIQDATGGIVVRFSDEHSFDLGEAVRIDIGGLELSEFNGLLQVNNTPNGNVTSLGAGTLPTPRVATVQEVIDNQEAWESTLVTIEGVTISGNSTYSGGTTVTDASGSIAMFTRSQATFADTALPSGAVDMTAIVSEFNEPQVLIRNLSDIVE